MRFKRKPTKATNTTQRPLLVDFYNKKTGARQIGWLCQRGNGKNYIKNIPFFETVRASKIVKKYPYTGTKRNIWPKNVVFQ